MKFFLYILTFFTSISIYSQVGIGTSNPHPSSILELSSTTQGLLPPRMTLAQRNAIVSPANGLMVYVTDVSCFQFYNGTTWSNCLGDVQPNVLRCGTSVTIGFASAGNSLNVSNSITIKVFVNFIDTYTISTNTINGYSFSGTGTFTSLGINTITLLGSGTPVAAQTDNFTITMAGSATTCSHSVTIAPPPLASCKAYKTAGFNTDGIYSVDPDGVGGNPAFNCYCDMTNNGGGWTLVFAHDQSIGGLWANDAQADQFDIFNPSLTAGKYSILFRINEIANISGGNPYTFRLNYPSLSKTNIWSQTTSPRIAGTVTGYTPISISMTANGWGGLEFSGTNTYLDGTVNNGNWYYSIGTQVVWPSPPGQTPADNVGVNITQLFIR